MRFFCISIFITIQFLLYSQNEVTISVKENNILYRGYSNLIEIGLNSYCDDSLWLECPNCDSVYNTGYRSYVVRPSNSRNVDLNIRMIYQDSILTVSTKNFIVHDLPNPDIKFEIFSSNEKIIITKLIESLKKPQYSNDLSGSKIRKPRLYAVYEIDRVLSAKFTVKNWRIKLNNKVYEGNGSLTNSDLLEKLTNMEFRHPVYMEVNLEVIGPDNKSRDVTEIFEIVP